MSIVVAVVLIVLAANSAIAFFVAFFWQAKVIFTVLRVSDWSTGFWPWNSRGNPNGPQNTFGRFVAGEIFPELRKKWLKAIAYVVASYAVLFMVASLVQLVAPQYLP